MTAPEPSREPTNAELHAEMGRLRAAVAAFMEADMRKRETAPANPGHFPGPDSRGSVWERAAALGWHEARKHPVPADASAFAPAAGTGAIGGVS